MNPAPLLLTFVIPLCRRRRAIAALVGHRGPEPEGDTSNGARKLAPLPRAELHNPGPDPGEASRVDPETGPATHAMPQGERPARPACGEHDKASLPRKA